MRKSTPSPFQHDTLEKLDSDQRAAFQTALGKLVTHHKRITPVEAAERKWTGDIIRREMVKLRGHLRNICKITGPNSKLQGYFWGAYVGWKASEDDRKAIAGFPKMADLMHRIVVDSIENETYKIPPETEKSRIIALQAAQLLEGFGIKATITVKKDRVKKPGAWCALTEYIILHGRGRYETSANLNNILVSSGFISTLKKEE